MTSGDMGALVAYGGKTAVRTEAAMLADNAPQLMRELLAPDAPEFCRLLVADMRDRDSKGHRTAMTLYAQIMKAVGAEQDLVTALLAGFGLGSLAELEQRVALTRSLEGVVETDSDAQGVAYFRRRMRADPGLRAKLMRDLFGEVEAEVVAQDAPERPRLPAVGLTGQD